MPRPALIAVTPAESEHDSADWYPEPANKCCGVEGEMSGGTLATAPDGGAVSSQRFSFDKPLLVSSKGVSMIPFETGKVQSR